MRRYIAGRILLIIPTLLAMIFIIFFILNVTPGDPGRIILGSKAPQDLVDEMNESLGMNKPLLQRYAGYVIGAVQGDFGLSYRTREPVFSDVLKKFPTTLYLAVLSIFVSAVIGIPLGIVSAVKQHSAIDYSLTVSALLLASIPTFFFGLLLILLFSLKLGLLPSNGIGSLKYFILPVVTLALPNAAYLARYMRTSMLETMRQDYISTARAKGASQKRIIFGHAFRAAFLPIITLLALNFSNMLSGALITETVFGLPGIGSVILDATQMKDTPVILACAILLAVIFKLSMLLVDVLQAMIDPRLRARFN